MQVKDLIKELNLCNPNANIKLLVVGRNYGTHVGGISSITKDVINGSITINADAEVK